MLDTKEEAVCPAGEHDEDCALYGLYKEFYHEECSSYENIEHPYVTAIKFSVCNLFLLRSGKNTHLAMSPFAFRHKFYYSDI